MYVEDAAAEELNVALLEEAPSYSAEIKIDSTYREKVGRARFSSALSAAGLEGCAPGRAFFRAPPVAVALDDER